MAKPASDAIIVSDVDKPRGKRLHVPVLLHEMLEALKPRSAGIYLDGTLGAAGYSEAILRASGPEGRVIGLDLDKNAVDRGKERLREFGDRFIGIHAGFQRAKEVLESLSIKALDGAVLDLGLSTDQLDDPDRGFSFRFSGPLDMRFDTDSGESLMELLDRISVKQLEEIISTFGDERYFRKVARAVTAARDRKELKTTQDLAEILKRALPKRRARIHPATRSFQALRIAVNKEMENLAVALNDIPETLAPGGCFCVVSYHSLEDRQVKHSFRERVKGRSSRFTGGGKPIRPEREEIERNPRSRSAKMRAIVLKAVVEREDNL
jgi:16S rRNA (cytosine1402-N4)-methyltransferase